MTLAIGKVGRRKFGLPIEVAGEAIAILAKRGAGKTNTATVIAEEVFRAGIQTVILDPIGVWWGIRSSLDGEGPGLPIPIVGGPHGDIPLEETAGVLMADVVVDTGSSFVLDLTDLPSKAAERRFVADFAERLYRRKARAISLMHLILEEADAFAPQRAIKGQERMVGAIDVLARRGRSRGIGITMVCQRSAKLNKDILTQADTLIAMRTIAPHDIDPIRAWVKHHDVVDDFIGSLPTLKNGECWVYSPERGIMERVQIRYRSTFDSSKTPTVGAKLAQPKKTATVDMAELGDQIASTVASSKANDPKELQKRIRALESELRTAVAPVGPSDDQIAVQIQDQVDRAVVMGVEQTQAALQPIISTLLDHTKSIGNSLEGVLAIVEELELFSVQQPISSPTQLIPPKPVARSRMGPVHSGNGDVSLNKGERAILTATAQYHAGVTREQLTVLTAYKRSSRDTYLQRLRAKGYVEVAGNVIRATSDGVFALGTDWEPLPIGEALRHHWLSRLPIGERVVLEVVIASYPNSVDREAISEVTPYKRSSRDTYLQRLVARQLVTKGDRGTVRASADLF